MATAPDPQVATVSNPFDVTFDEDPELDLELEDEEAEEDDLVFVSAGAAAEEEVEDGAAPLVDPVVFPAWRDSDEFEALTTPGGQNVVLRLDADADLTQPQSQFTIAYWPAEFIVPLEQGDGLWSVEAAQHYAQVTAEEAGDAYIDEGVTWGTVQRAEGVTELGRYERNDVFHVVVLLELDDAQSVAFVELEEDEEVYASPYEFADFDEVEREVMDFVF
ncbi:MAG: hypothetical protein JWN72_2978 [Thermoleophilia bacterium]|nr:hypothetical protein [Thermoleophilia bacterium]